MTTPGSFEADLRAVLRAQRPSEGATSALRARVGGIPSALGRQSRFPVLIRRVGLPLSATVIAAAAAVLAVFGLSRAPFIGLAPGVGGAEVASFDPSLEGFGLITSLIPTLQVAQWIVVGIALLLAFRIWFGAGRGTTRAKLLGLLSVFVAIVVAPTTVVAPLDDIKPGFQPGNITAVLAGYDGDARDRPFDQFSRYYETASPAGPLITMFSIANGGPLPLRLEGVIVSADSAKAPTAHWTAVWLPAVPGAAAGDLQELRPFEPRTVNPGDQLEVYLVGRAGPCAFGPGFNPESQAAGYTMLGPTVEIAYSLAGLTGRTTIDTGQAFVEGSKLGCNLEVGT